MIIGIDFDNTIVKYDNLFKKVALTEGFIKENWNGNGKTGLRNHLCRQPNGEQNWMKLQSLIYGKYIHDAVMMPGVASFLFSCKIRKNRVFIVSHKTEYGHYDPEKISLRAEALNWLETNRFFDEEYFGLNREDVFFADTREEKVNIILHLKCDWFIDDLPEVFEESHFPSSTQKVLFGLYEPALIRNTTVLSSWRKVSEKILGRITDEDIIAWSKGIVNEPSKQVEKFFGGGNSAIYKITVSSRKSYALKYYPDPISDTRPRLKTEFNTLRLLHQHGITNVPNAVKKDDALNLGLYEWIKGEKVTEPSFEDLDQVVRFAKELFSLSQQIDGNSIDTASEACLSAKDLVHQIEKRLLRLKEESKHFHELSQFLEGVFEPLWKEVKDERISLWPEESRYKSLPLDKHTLSPSDFGFHNCLKASDGSMTFLDFDYFGWDDPVKFTADFIWHPAMNLNRELKEKWKTAMVELYSGDPYFEDRLNAAILLYGLRWAMIVLNEYLPGFTERRKEAGESDSYDPEESRKTQLNKAKRYCDEVKAMSPQVTFA